MVKAPRMTDGAAIRSRSGLRVAPPARAAGAAGPGRWWSTPADIDETPLAGERPADYVRRDRGRQVRRGRRRRRARPTCRPCWPSSAADTIVIVGRPRSWASPPTRTTRAGCWAAWPGGGTTSPPPTASASAAGRWTARSRPPSRSARCDRPRSTPTSPRASGGARPAATRCRGSRARSSPSCAARTRTSSACRVAELLADLQALEALPALSAARVRRAVGRRDARRGDRRRPGARCASASPRAERAAGRPPGSVRLLAVSKKMPADDVRAALAAGQRAFGENYAQELRDKRGAARAIDAAGAARVALHRAAAEQQGEVRRRPAWR